MNKEQKEIWTVTTKRGESRGGFGLNNNPISRRNRAEKKRKKYAEQA